MSEHDGSVKKMRASRLTASLFLAAGVFSQLASAAAARPNLVLILTDDQGYGDLSCHGNPILKTPNLDRLAREGVEFSNFHVSPTCSPTRSVLMSAGTSS